MDSHNRPSRSTGKIPRIIINSRPSQVNRSLFNRSQSMCSSMLATPLRSPNRLNDCSSASSLMSSVRRRSRSASTDRNSFRGDKPITKDSRPLTDKRFQYEAYNLVRDYFAEKDMNMTPLPLKCRALHLHQYLTMMTVLLGNFFKKISLNKHNYIILIMELMKKLNYPGTLNKSWLQTAYSTNSWPNVLGTLHWLISIVQIYKENKNPLDFMFPVDDFAHDDKVKESLKAKILFDLFLNSYVLWNEQDMEGCEREKQNFANDLSNIVPTPNIETLESKYYKLQKESEEIDTYIDNEEEKIQKIKKEYMENEKHSECLVNEIDFLKKVYCEEKDIDEEILIWQNKLEEQQQQQKQLIYQIENQEVSETDYQTYLYEKSNLEREIKSRKEINQQFQQTLYQVKDNVSQSKIESQKLIQEHKLLVVTNIEKRPEWSDLLFLELPKTTKEEEDHFILIQKQIADLEKKNDEMEKTIQKQRMNLDMDKEKKTFELEELRSKKKQLENKKNELEVNTNKEIKTLELDIKNAERYNEEIAKEFIQKEQDVQKLIEEENDWKKKIRDLKEQRKQMNEHAKLRFSQLLESKTMANERYKEIYAKLEETFKDKKK